MNYIKTFCFNTDWLKIKIDELEKSLSSSLSFIEGFKQLKCRTETDEFIPDMLDLLIEIESDGPDSMVTIALELGLLLHDYVEDWIEFEHTTMGYDEALKEKQEEEKQNKSSHN